MAGKPEICSICDVKFDGVTNEITVKKVGLKSLINASKERGEDRHLNWLDVEELVVHKKCQLGYICKRQIAAEKKRKLKASEDSTKPKPKGASNTSDLKKQCLICSVICDEADEEEVKKSELKKLISISQELGDDKNLKWIDVEEILVHKKCYADYLSKSTPAGKKKKLDESSTNSEVASNVFDFKKLCFICGLTCDEKAEKKKSKDKRRRISSIVPESSIKGRLLEACKNGDEESSKVLERIANIEDLSTVGAKYHADCFQKFCRKREQERKCVCRKNCNPNSCICIKSGRLCSEMCKNCTDVNCSNKGLENSDDKEVKAEKSYEED